MTLPVGTLVETPPVGGAPLRAETACEPIYWSGMTLVLLKGLSGWWECKRLRLVTP